MDNIEIIKNKIINDSENLQFKKQGYQPIFMANKNAKILIIGQAPGLKTQEKGFVFMDKSGDKLREWLGITYDYFYNSGEIAVLPLDFYYPGKAKTGDLPPRIEFAEKWHKSIIDEMPNIKLTILIGTYACKYYLGDTFRENLTETVRAYRAYLPKYFPLVHPSPLNFRWFNNNKWFGDVIKELQEIVKIII
ncbi:uracil-DNA glycosylase family protein [Haploplasma axanthum]|uniref:Uracil DNA glycosylase superfamily n=1 Tax=Haploplasma axanthum TaxID=29552 RepID=A0A449BEJ9_HAPAX|nr:uracil-DNA glycosylase family protein [Haploplasma axanthum]VEU80852.1 Uracil DNA glycosylase superfamily [Haploplasma axanthum]